MKQLTTTIQFEVLDNSSGLPAPLQPLVERATMALEHAYAPYSKFRVGAALLLSNGAIVTGSNQENAASPVGLCAERVALSAASSMHPGIAIVALAVAVPPDRAMSDAPVAPCGICRQTILEYEQRFHHDIEIILPGGNGRILRIKSVKDLLPLYFSKDDL